MKLFGASNGTCSSLFSNLRSLTKRIIIDKGQGEAAGGSEPRRVLLADARVERLARYGLHAPCSHRHRQVSHDAQEWLERKIQNTPEGQGTVRMLSPEEWDEIQEIRPRTPFESKLARPNVRIRTDESVHLEDLKDWTIDVITDALSRAEEAVKQK